MWLGLCRRRTTRNSIESDRTMNITRKIKKRKQKSKKTKKTSEPPTTINKTHKSNKQQREDECNRVPPKSSEIKSYTNIF